MCKPFQPRQSTGIFDKVFWADLDRVAQCLDRIRALVPQETPLPKIILSFAALIGLACRSRHGLVCALFKKQCDNWRRPLRRLAQSPVAATTSPPPSRPSSSRLRVWRTDSHKLLMTDPAPRAARSGLPTLSLTQALSSPPVCPSRWYCIDLHFCTPVRAYGRFGSSTVLGRYPS